MCGRDFVRYDLAHYLDADFRGEFLDPYILAKPTPRIRMYHSVGASDPLTAAEVQAPIGDGLPETLADWIPYNGVTAIKIKLNGDDLAWDVDRVASIDIVATQEQARLRRPRLALFARFQRALPQRRNTCWISSAA